MADEVAQLDRQIVRGDCMTVSVTYKDADDNPFNLTGYNAEIGAYDLVGASAGTHWLGDANSTVTGAGAGTVVIDATGGVVTATVPKTITANWTVQKKSAKYALAIIAAASAGGCRKTLLTGFVEVEFSAIVSAGG